MRPPSDDPGEGTFQLLFERHPEIAKRETRSIFVPTEDEGVPPGQYDFAEAFCMGRNCDCRRVMFMVHRSSFDHPERSEHVTTIGYGWEPPGFYLEWMFGDREGAEFMRGPVIEPNSPPCDYDVPLLQLFERTCLTLPDYVDRVRRHYEQFKRR